MSLTKRDDNLRIIDLGDDSYCPPGHDVEKHFSLPNSFSTLISKLI